MSKYIKIFTKNKDKHEETQVIQSSDIHIHSPKYGVSSNRKIVIFFLFLNKNICCGCSSEAPHLGASDEHPYVFMEK